MRFSQRHGHAEVRTALQTESIDQDLRVSIWNAFFIVILQPEDTQIYDGLSADLTTFAKRLWLNYFKAPLESVPTRYSDFKGRLTRHLREEAEWFELYDFIEACFDYYPKEKRLETFGNVLNKVLERESAGFRIVANHVTPIVSEVEVASIERAITASESTPGTKHHLENALSLLSDRENPDFANSIKESISAVEAACRSITGKPNATLGQAINQLKGSGVTIHPALESAWKSHYGYASDEGGVRHAAMSVPNARAEDALYFLVSCSAFVNLLLSKVTAGQVSEAK